MHSRLGQTIVLLRSITVLFFMTHGISAYSLGILGMKKDAYEIARF